MKKIFYSCALFIAALVIFASKADAQYHITSESWVLPTDSAGTYCGNPTMHITTNAYTTGLNVKTYFGDGNTGSTPVLDGGTSGYANFYGYYSFPGTYSVKYELYNGTALLDSVLNPHEYFYCNTAIIKCVDDSLGTGIYDSNDHFMVIPLKLQVDHNGIPEDTIAITSGQYYSLAGAPGDVYAFRILSLPPGLTFTFPAGGVLYDTVQAINNNYVPKFFGFKCTGTTSFDLAIHATEPITGINDQGGYIYVSNASCDPVDATVTMTFSPKYAFLGRATPTASSASGNTITWNLSGISSLSPVKLSYNIADVARDLVAGDTVHDQVIVTPTDPDPSNNVEIIVDTVLAGVDPNEMSVSPPGYITAGTTLKYTINFENTGTDTAYNISVYDTLSDNVNPQSLNIVMASAVMNIAMLNQGGHNIVKFDFPNINLLDSANHGQCNGAVIFTVNTLPGLPDGTTIFNHAGIFFDYNPVVMTNTVEDIIGTPSLVATISNPSTIALYPNPASASITILSTNQPINQVTVTNLVGQTLCNNQYNSKQIQINVSSLPSGLYFVKVNGNEVRKFVKE